MCIRAFILKNERYVNTLPRTNNQSPAALPGDTASIRRLPPSRVGVAMFLAPSLFARGGLVLRVDLLAGDPSPLQVGVREVGVFKVSALEVSPLGGPAKISRKGAVEGPESESASLGPPAPGCHQPPAGLIAPQEAGCRRRLGWPRVRGRVQRACRIRSGPRRGRARRGGVR
jgi:hypothetical protein